MRVRILGTDGRNLTFGSGYETFLRDLGDRATTNLSTQRRVPGLAVDAELTDLATGVVMAHLGGRPGGPGLDVFALSGLHWR